MPKKKISKKIKTERRLKEVSKASGKVLIKNKNEVNVRQVVSEIDTYHLPINEIKKDLWKNAIYAVFSIVAVITIKVLFPNR